MTVCQCDILPSFPTPIYHLQLHSHAHCWIQGKPVIKLSINFYLVLEFGVNDRPCGHRIDQEQEQGPPRMVGSLSSINDMPYEIYWDQGGELICARLTPDNGELFTVHTKSLLTGWH